MPSAIGSGRAPEELHRDIVSQRPGAASPAQSRWSRQHLQCVWCDTHPATVLLAVALPSATVPCRSLPWLTVSLLGHRFAQPLRPPSVRLLRHHGLNCGDHVLQLRNLAQSAPGWQPIVLGHRQDERALVRLQAFEEGVDDAHGAQKPSAPLAELPPAHPRRRSLRRHHDPRPLRPRERTH